jgi:pyruvate dehydrogenase E1 component beta subunit
MVEMALEAAAQAEKAGISAEVIDLRSLEPLDMETVVASIKKTGRAIVVDEDVTRCGATGEIGMQIMERAFNYLKAPVRRVAALNYPVPAGTLEQEVLPRPQRIAEAMVLDLR